MRFRLLIFAFSLILFLITVLMNIDKVLFKFFFISNYISLSMIIIGFTFFGIALSLLFFGIINSEKKLIEKVKQFKK